MKVLFMGTPGFAAASLDALLKAGHDVPAVVTQPTVTSGKVRRTRHSEVRDLASAAGIRVLQPASMRDPALRADIVAIAPEIMVVVAFGRLLPGEVIALAPRGALNVHASLLPRHRGASPIPWAILSGDAETGVTTMQINERMDAGDILLQRATPIGPEETAGELELRLRAMGAALLLETLEGVAGGTIVPAPQDEAVSTTAPMLRKQDGLVDWRMAAAAIERRVRAFDPWPGAWTRRGGAPDPIRIWKAAVAAGSHQAQEPGRILAAAPGPEGGLLVACGDNTCLLLREVQMPGRRRLPALEAARGRQLETGDLLGAR